MNESANESAEKAVIDLAQQEYHVASFVLQAIPEQANELKNVIQAIKGAEIHAVSEQGKIVFTLEDNSQKAIGKAIDKLKYHQGILSLAPVYHQFLPADA